MLLCDRGSRLISQRSLSGTVRKTVAKWGSPDVHAATIGIAVIASVIAGQVSVAESTVVVGATAIGVAD